MTEYHNLINRKPYGLNSVSDVLNKEYCSLSLSKIILCSGILGGIPID